MAWHQRRLQAVTREFLKPERFRPEPFTPGLHQLKLINHIPLHLTPPGYTRSVVVFYRCGRLLDVGDPRVLHPLARPTNLGFRG